jgi:hypothetical protein
MLLPDMSSLFIPRIWILCLLVGGVLLCFPRTRRQGLYAMGIATGAMLVQGLFLIGWALLPERMAQQGGMAMFWWMLVAYGLSGWIGGFAGFWVTRKLLRRRSPGGPPLTRA